MLEKVSEQILVIDNKFVDNSSVDILRWEFILIALLYYLSHLSEMAGYCRGVIVDDQVVMTNHILQEVGVVWKILQKWFELFAVSFVLQVFTSLKDKLLNFIVGHLTQSS